MENSTLNANARAVLEVLRATGRHPTALEVYNEVRQVRPRIGLATVYRVLHQLAELGLIKETQGYENECRYDAHTRRHDHAICRECGALLDIPVDIPLPDEALRAAALSVGIELDTHEVRIYGRCGTCKEKMHG